MIIFRIIRVFAFAKVKPRKVNEAMKLFSEERFNVDVLKVEVPVNMLCRRISLKVKSFIQKEAAQYFRDQEASTQLPYIYLSVVYLQNYSKKH